VLARHALEVGACPQRTPAGLVTVREHRHALFEQTSEGRVKLFHKKLQSRAHRRRAPPAAPGRSFQLQYGASAPLHAADVVLSATALLEAPAPPAPPAQAAQAAEEAVRENYMCAPLLCSRLHRPAPRSRLHPAPCTLHPPGGGAAAGNQDSDLIAPAASHTAPSACVHRFTHCNPAPACTTSQKQGRRCMRAPPRLRAQLGVQLAGGARRRRAVQRPGAGQAPAARHPQARRARQALPALTALHGMHACQGCQAMTRLQADAAGGREMASDRAAALSWPRIVVCCNSKYKATCRALAALLAGTGRLFL
jgi:hypothetical protein